MTATVIEHELIELPDMKTVPRCEGRRCDRPAVYSIVRCGRDQPWCGHTSLSCDKCWQLIVDSRIPFPSPVAHGLCGAVSEPTCAMADVMKAIPL